MEPDSSSKARIIASQEAVSRTSNARHDPSRRVVEQLALGTECSMVFCEVNRP